MRTIHLNVTEKFQPSPWSVTENTFKYADNRARETIFALANGYIGVRGGFEEGYLGPEETSDFDTMLNGVYTFFDYHHVWARPGYPKRWHSITCQANPFLCEIYADGERVCISEDKCLNFTRTLDLFNGVMTRSYTYILKNGKKLNLFFERFLSLDNTHLALQNIKLSSNDKINIKISSIISKKMSTERFKDDGRKNESLFTNYQKLSNEDEIFSCEQELKVSNFVVVLSSFATVEGTKPVIETFDKQIKSTFEFVLEGEKSLYRYSAFTSGQEKSDYLSQASKFVKGAFRVGYSELKEAHAKKWHEFWAESNVELDGDLSILQGLRFCLFMVNASCGRDGKTNISANGLMGIGYCGQSFWDTELFIQPMYNYTTPEVTKQLILYRYKLLPNAKIRAKEMDDQGALFAWNTINGEECGHVFEAATAQYHINPDIFYSIYRYYEATLDEQFLVDYCAEILFEISKCMAHRGAFIPLKGNKFCINVVCGPDEYTPIVDNNTYTNFLTKKQLYFTLWVKDLLKSKYPAKLKDLMEKCEVNEDEFALWKKAADNMYIGYSKELDIITQDDQFLFRDPVDIDYLAEHKYPLLFNLHPLNLWRYQVCKQADLVFLTYIYSNEFDKDMIKRIYDFYEPRTIHDSSLSSSIHSIVACSIGYYDKAYGYLKQACRMDLDNYNKNVGEGIHAACSGGAYQMIVNGYAGLRVYDDILHFNPFIDSKWNYLKFTLRFRGAKIELKINKENTEYSLVEGEEISFFHGEQKYNLSKSQPKCVVDNLIILKGDANE